MKWRRGVVALGSLVSVAMLVTSQLAYAADSSSANYSVDQVFMGAGGELNACSASYCSKQTAGEIAAGNTASNAFKAQAGFNTDRNPYLAFSVVGSNTDLGTIGTSGTATATGTFAVKTYLAQGYVVMLASDPPTNTSSGHVITGLTSPTTPSVGVEQFGVNLVHNTSPIAFGAPPVQVPDNTFSFGTVASGYGTANNYKYVKGDTIASSSTSSGETDYTLSFIYNISNLTPDGTYVYNGVLVATSTY
ncbi:MAG TPA: hypothetical protein VLH86_04380 [Patescibacteria group bacterium]|nr:hypothetical protein [Patescibacteria group bacterium]